MIKTLSIETSCDDTSIWIISFDWEIFKSQKLLAYSQIDDHQKYWWVVPEIASRLHSEKIIKVLDKIWFSEIKKIDFISITTHPWLPWSLVVWKAIWNLLWEYFQKPIVEVNHIYWHIFSLLLEKKLKDITFPIMVLTASWWHNDLYLVEKTNPPNKGDDLIKWGQGVWTNIDSKFQITKVWHTLDDAAWECFDKVARMLGGPYPWWQRISQKAAKWKPNPDLKFKRIFLSKDKFEFSFSWFKSQAYNMIKKLEKNWKKITEKIICDISYEFQEAVVEVLVKKLIKAWKIYNAKTLGIAWWVSCNDRLREYLNESTMKQWDIKILKPTKKIYSTDNAAMIGVAWILKNMWKI